MTDALTGLPNRRHALQQLKTLWEESTRSASPLSVMMIDADHFKEVNDTCGHDAGDLVLGELARTLQHAVRTDDLVSRLGGDEFLIICPDTDSSGGRQIAETVRKKFLTCVCQPETGVGRAASVLVWPFEQQT